MNDHSKKKIAPLVPSSDTADKIGVSTGFWIDWIHEKTARSNDKNGSNNGCIASPFYIIRVQTVF